jgi:ribosome-binding factor A
VTRRIERVAEELREQIAGIVAELKDPRIGFVTVTRVEVAVDLGTARVFIGVLGNEARRSEALAALKRSAGFVRRQLAQRIRMRSVPEVVFTYDKGLDAADRVARILEELHEPKPEE